MRIASGIPESGSRLPKKKLRDKLSSKPKRMPELSTTKKSRIGRKKKRRNRSWRSRKRKN